MKIGIIGWRGFIGTHLLRKIDNPILFQGDMTNIQNVELFVNQCDRIYHLAGHNRDCEGNILANNLVSTGNLILSTKIKKINPEIIFTSSNAVINYPDSEYGLTKSIEEKIVKKAKKWSVYRIPNVYGGGCRPNYNSVVATFAYQIVHGEIPQIHKPDETREFIYIDDLINSLLSPKLFKITNPVGEIMSIKQIYELLTSRLGEHKNIEKTFNWYNENK